MDELAFLEKGLIEYNLANIKGSPFDNAFDVFRKSSNEINLILLGTNGNMSDAIKSNIEWIQDREKSSSYNHLISGDWGKSPLRKELMKVPDVLNECFNTNSFSISNMIITNGLLLASEGVKDIRNKFNELKEVNSSFEILKDLIQASMSFFDNYTLKNSNPKIIFAYGNSDEGHSAWKYLRDFYPEIKGKVSVKIKSTSYKFCSLEINNKEVYIIGSPHPCFAYNKLDAGLIQKGLHEIGAI